MCGGRREIHHALAQGAHVDGLHETTVGRGHVLLYWRHRQMALRAIEQVGRPTERGHHAGEALGRRAGLQRPLQALRGGAAIRCQAAQAQQFRRQRQRERAQARAGGATAQQVEGGAHLQRVARLAPQHLAHVAQRDAEGKAAASGHGLHARGQGLCRGLVGRLRAAAGLDVQYQGLRAAGGFLDRIEATMSSGTSTVALTSRTA